MRTRMLAALLLALVAPAWSQAPQAPPTRQGAQASEAPTGARFVESCQQALEHGVVPPGCQGPLYAAEIDRLKNDALRTQNPALLTLLGDAYQSPRSGMADLSQAYRWYLLGAVRGDARAMERLGVLHGEGRGAPRDPVRALGYARLSERLSRQGCQSARAAAATIRKLGSEMAAEEVVLAERFAAELEAALRTGGRLPAELGAAAAPAAPTRLPLASEAATGAEAAGQGASSPLLPMPGLGAARHAAEPAPTTGSGASAP